MTARTSGPFWKMRRRRGSTPGSTRATVRSSSASSMSRSRRQPLRTVRRTRVVSMSATERLSRSSTLDRGGPAEGLAVLDAREQALGQAAGVAAALEVPVEGGEGRLPALEHAVLELLQEARLAQAARARHPDGVRAGPPGSRAADGSAAEEVLAPDPAAGDEGVAHAEGRLVSHRAGEAGEPAATGSGGGSVVLARGAPRPRPPRTSSRVMTERSCSSIRFTAWMQNFWMR